MLWNKMDSTNHYTGAYQVQVLSFLPHSLALQKQHRKVHFPTLQPLSGTCTITTQLYKWLSHWQG